MCVFLCRTVSFALVFRSVPSKALAQQTLNLVSFARSSRGAAKHTAKNANLDKTRSCHSSLFAGSISDARLPFPISAKREKSLPQRPPNERRVIPCYIPHVSSHPRPYSLLSTSQNELPPALKLL